MMNQIERADSQEVVNWLKEHFPKAFKSKKREVKPFQLGIMESLLDYFERLDVPPFSKKKLRQGLNFYTSSTAYLTAQQEGVYRIDLFGEEIEQVDAEQAKYALEKLNERKAKKEAKVTASSDKAAGN